MWSSLLLVHIFLSNFFLPVNFAFNMLWYSTPWTALSVMTLCDSSSLWRVSMIVLPLPSQKSSTLLWLGSSRGLMDRASDLWPEVGGSNLSSDRNCPWLGETLEQGTEPPTAPRLSTAPGVCALGWVKRRAQISLLVILCIIVYVTNKKIFYSPVSKNKRYPQFILYGW